MFSDFFECVATYDPGWNDPPPMPSATPQPIAPGKSRTSLNKRVAFPMQSASASSTAVKTTAEGLPLPFSTAKYQPPPMNTAPLPEVTAQPVLPPPPTATIFNPAAPIQAIPTESATEGFDAATAKQLLQSVLTRLVEAMASTTDAGRVSEIRKRLDTLDQMWLENKLNKSAQTMLYDLAKGKVKTFAILLKWRQNLFFCIEFNELFFFWFLNSSGK